MPCRIAKAAPLWGWLFAHSRGNLPALPCAGVSLLCDWLAGEFRAQGEYFFKGQGTAAGDFFGGIAFFEEIARAFADAFQNAGVMPTATVPALRRIAVHFVQQCREGVNLSGGETQKLLLARAIYREAPILVLDEPTAALDAVAENQMYLKYNELTKGRTSLFISHRLSSTRFCDRILMLENGRILEQGSHQELMEKKGAYYQLFQVQSHYYQNDRESGFSSEMDPDWEVSSYVSG